MAADPPTQPRRRRAISTRRQAIDDALARLSRLHPKKIDLSLGRLQRLLAALGDPQDRLPPVVHVAGTNGKGSTCAYLRAMAEASGEKVHVYTSPHLVDFNERIVLAGEQVSDTALIEAFARCEAANFGEPITFFEITTAAALLLFSETPADRLILEVGLGGKYDATNVIARPSLSVITPVSLDHQEFLGPDLRAIAGEKAGILKFGVPAVIGPQEEVAEAAILEAADGVGAPAWLAGRDYQAYVQHGRLVYEDENRVWDLPPPALIGPHQFINAGIAAASAVHLGWEEKAAAEGIAAVSWPARMQPISSGPLGEIARKAGAELWLDGGHNESAARALSIAVADMNERDPRPLVIIAGFSPNKDAKAWFAQFGGLARQVIAIEFESGRGGSQPCDHIAAQARSAQIEADTAPSLLTALKRAARHQPTPRILIAGSLYLAGEALAIGGDDRPQATPG